MIRYIKGIYAMNTPSGIVLENQSGIGFEISIPQGSPIYKNQIGDNIQVFTEMIVREDDISLFGFHNKDSVDFFNLLTSVSGIGPKGAMAILGSMPIEQLRQAIVFGDVKAVSQAQGVGKKTAERLIIELKDKVGTIEMSTTLSSTEISSMASDNSDSRSEAINALVALGYTKQEAFAAVSHVSEEGLSSEEYIKKVLKNLF